MSRRTKYYCLLLVVLLAAAGIVAAGIGSKWIPPGEIIRGLADSDSMVRIIVINLRLPRILMALLIGAALSLSGALLQAVMGNPLADPGIIGVSAGAAAAATSVMLLAPDERARI